MEGLLSVGLILTDASVKSQLPVSATLPSARTRLLGRDRELGRIAALLKHPSVRLLTITGPGGELRTMNVLAASRIAA
jgi:hypothetical protein